MSNTRAIIDYAMDDNGKELRSALYAEIHDRVMGHIEAKKIELAGGVITQEEVFNESDVIIEEMERIQNKINKLREEISLLEASACEMSDDDDDEDDEDDEKLEKKKKKLKKNEKKMKKLKEAFALLESEGVDDEGEWSEEEFEEEEESEDE